MNYLTNIQNVINKSGLKKTFIAKELGIKYDTFRRKLNGENEFKLGELLNLTKILNIKITEVFTNGKEN